MYTYAYTYTYTDVDVYIDIHIEVLSCYYMDSSAPWPCNFRPCCIHTPQTLGITHVFVPGSRTLENLSNVWKKPS